MIFKTETSAEDIAAKLIEMVRQEMLEPFNGHKVAVALTNAYCRAMLRTVQGVTEDGRDILTVIQDCKAIATFPDPRRHSYESITKATDGKAH